MNTHSIYTRKKFGLDNSVWAVLIVTAILSLGLLGYNLSGKKEMVPIDFTIHSLEEHQGDLYEVGEVLVFKASVNSEDIVWDFGDKSEPGKGTTVKHKYQLEGHYYVKAGTDPAVTKGVWIDVVKATKMENGITGLEISGNNNSVTGKMESFTCMVNATHYEWMILNVPNTTKTGRTVSFNFPYASKFIVQVILDHDPAKRYRKDITVDDSVVIPKSLIPANIEPLIPTGETNPDQAELITNETFKVYMDKVVYGEMTVKDFDKFLCGKGSTKVILNGDRKNLKSFDEVCEELNGKRKRKNFLSKKRTIKITTAVLERGADNCVQLIRIDYN